jgi:hypothetical protein
MSMFVEGTFTTAKVATVPRSATSTLASSKNTPHIGAHTAGGR